MVLIARGLLCLGDSAAPRGCSPCGRVSASILAEFRGTGLVGPGKYFDGNCCAEGPVEPNDLRAVQHPREGGPR